ncbi:MAG: hypothetical protein GXP13_03010 [Gammaproteobacteria bacterium]|nr:hypothetical protein [Gammaproteobacteria bacterium]
MALTPEQIRPGACYSNGEFGKKWIVWQVAEMFIDESDIEMIRYRILVGENRRKYRAIFREDFVKKIRYEVELMESTWQKVE